MKYLCSSMDSRSNLKKRSCTVE